MSPSVSAKKPAVRAAAKVLPYTGREYLDSLVDSLGEMKIEVETAIRHGSNPRKEIVGYAREIHPDLLVMGAHGHGGIKDLIFGNTINPVRHKLNIPILVVRG